MRDTRKMLILPALFLGLALLAACAQANLPTPIPTAAVPTTPAPTLTRTALPPTRDLATVTPRPTSVVPTRPPTITATPVVAPILSIASPVEGARLPLGGEVEVSGFTHSLPGMTLQVGLTSHNGWVLATSTGTVESGSWQATLEVPANVYGAAELRAVLLDAGGSALASDRLPVFVDLGATPPENYMALSRPQSGMQVVAGHTLYFDGRLQNTGGGQIRLSVWMDDCQEEVANYSFTIRGSTYWQGYVILPEEVEGPGCALVTTGTPGEETWLAAQVPLVIRPRTDDSAHGIVIANPPPGRRLFGGQTILVNGVAYNAPGGDVHVSVMLANGRQIAETTVKADYFGFWGLEVTLPPDVNGQAQVQAVIGDPLAPVAATQQLFDLVAGESSP